MTLLQLVIALVIALAGWWLHTQILIFKDGVTSRELYKDVWKPLNFSFKYWSVSAKTNLFFSYLAGLQMIMEDETKPIYVKEQIDLLSRRMYIVFNVIKSCHKNKNVKFFIDNQPFEQYINEVRSKYNLEPFS